MSKDLSQTEKDVVKDYLFNLFANNKGSSEGSLKQSIEKISEKWVSLISKRESVISINTTQLRVSDIETAKEFINKMIKQSWQDVLSAARSSIKSGASDE